MPTELERMARELLALQLDDGGCHTEANNVRHGIDLESYDVALRAIAAALQAQQPGAQAVAWGVRDHSDGKLWLVDYNEEHVRRQAEMNDDTLVPLYTQPPSIPEPSEDDVRTSCLRQRAERAEARVREAPVVVPEPARFEVAPEEYRDGASVEVPAQMIGKRVSLVLLDTDALTEREAG